jgi:hypothetical protein
MRSAASRCASGITCPVRPARQDGCQTARRAVLAQAVGQQSRSAWERRCCRHIASARSTTLREFPLPHARVWISLPLRRPPSVECSVLPKDVGSELAAGQVRDQSVRGLQSKISSHREAALVRNIGDGRPWGNRPRHNCPVLRRQTFRAGEIEPVHCAGLSSYGAQQLWCWSSNYAPQMRATGCQRRRRYGAAP